VLGSSRVSKADAARHGEARSWNAFVAIHRGDFLSSRSSCFKQLGCLVPRNRSASSETRSRRESGRVRATNVFPAAACAAAGQHT